MTKSKIELIYFRAFVCMLIILTHIITQYMQGIADSELSELKLIYYIQNIFIFGTPCFIILSQLLTTLNYKELKFDYLWSRFKYIFIPYLCIGSFYCYSETLNTNTSFGHQFVENVLLGYWYGYFIIVIMQFFILSYIIFKITPKLFNSKTLLGLSFIIQTTFLYFLQNSSVFSNIFHKVYPLSENTFILGWIFFFFVGGYVGLHYDKIIRFLEQYLFIIISLSIISYVGFAIFSKHDYWQVTSFTYSLTLYHMSMFLLLLGVCLHFKTLMLGSINLISTFSFFIYLLHPIILDTLYKYTATFENTTIIFIAISLLFILGLCVGVGIFLREFYIFRFLIGKQPYKLKIFLKDQTLM
ncbi:polysaccharide intercellular adhesin biosynthesis/export protein IcaC [Staphylococcus xylosus]|uniref:polysaccharide intercellular adhesin biosynthesis/export protein IcaC n=1 Tax=Staphylococcus xylosus TaxID=1288 RepID=UPI00049A4CCA|nr:polysaccharide intercellular adhesin biosynthesis/export protein IcaC [Staphylococcus xylosus]AID41541.1 Polysaccharide intercellular adhesin (PIA) biosynthesis protein IcaC [Staphylococcus xylosus]MBE6180590.1 poly-beta-1,6-N-acetyl-D-glucosamine export protein [Staphylococcus xylosus]RIM87880.1 poly-beta-1,6-N-acetyl-D-glucosamine export protein [Staphylococcus xylosus]WRY40268.1 polysaccharide intercellular adhesin biosynthesis/export protein IcaC [Staphylococcus xylosus]